MIKFKNLDEQGQGTPIPKVIWWYALATYYTGPINADYCNKLANNELKDFFEKYPEQVYNKILTEARTGRTNINLEDIELFNKEIKIEK